VAFAQQVPAAYRAVNEKQVLPTASPSICCGYGRRGDDIEIIFLLQPRLRPTINELAFGRGQDVVELRQLTLASISLMFEEFIF
jgi:hypothetical protein